MNWSQLWQIIQDNAAHIKIINDELGVIQASMGSVQASVDWIKSLIMWQFSFLGMFFVVMVGNIFIAKRRNGRG